MSQKKRHPKIGFVEKIARNDLTGIAAEESKPNWRGKHLSPPSSLIVPVASSSLRPVCGAGKEWPLTKGTSKSVFSVVKTKRSEKLLFPVFSVIFQVRSVFRRGQLNPSPGRAIVFD
ncbi:hypothetical protein CDAR_207011 [Caerostris darwini]|uniref:Uncharacterized protein n=1 Tax=Caerostris darwini TaxID=1538125 RepID=A0AAV4SRP9_9ARAC|nr:hypothetical protein CDAR_207011 [Caerostris darwini]